MVRFYDRVVQESFKTYVSNRLHQVQTLIPTCQWHHIDSLNNPADCASRGVMSSVLAHLTLYWSGPTLIYTDMSGWEQMSFPVPVDGLPELKPVVCTIVVDDARAKWFSHFSLFDRLFSNQSKTFFDHRSIENSTGFDFRQKVYSQSVFDWWFDLCIRCKTSTVKT